MNRSMNRFLTLGTIATIALTSAAFAQNSGTKPGHSNPPTHAPVPPAKAAGDVLTTLAASGQYKTFLSLAMEAGLNDTLKGKGPFTLFVPTDEAFMKLPASTLADLKKPENKEKLANILRLHIIAGAELKTSEVAKMHETSATLAGETLHVTSTDGKIEVGTMKVMATLLAHQNIRASNGVIHAIDTVLMPAAH